MVAVRIMVNATVKALWGKSLWNSCCSVWGKLICVCAGAKVSSTGLFWRESPDVPSFSRTLTVFVTIPTCSASTFSCSPDWLTAVLICCIAFLWETQLPADFFFCSKEGRKLNQLEMTETTRQTVPYWKADFILRWVIECWKLFRWKIWGCSTLWFISFAEDHIREHLECSSFGLSTV